MMCEFISGISDRFDLVSIGHMLLKDEAAQET